MRIAIDLDGVICPVKQPGDDYAALEPIPGAAARIAQMRRDGHHVIIVTARHMKTCDANVGLVVARVGKLTLDWLERHGIGYDEIWFGKPNAEVYIDDRALRFRSWDSITDDALARASAQR